MRFTNDSLWLMIESCFRKIPRFISLPFSSYLFDISKIYQPCQKLCAEAQHTGICYHQQRAWPLGSPCASSAGSLSGLWPGPLLHSGPQHEVLVCACTSCDKNCGEKQERGIEMVSCILLSWLSIKLYSYEYLMLAKERQGSFKC